MSTTIQKSRAFLTYVVSEHIQDLQILIDDVEVFLSLPGKLERQGIKTLASWPIFVTAVLNEGQFEAVSKTPQPMHISGGSS